jgi:hypothetical protein
LYHAGSEMVENMDSLYEQIDHSDILPAKVFVTSIENSGFHWHNDVEIILVLKGSVITYN